MRKILVVFLAALLPLAHASAQQLCLSTNVAEILAGGTMNIEAAYGLQRHWSVNAGVKYNPFSYGSGEDEVLLKQRALTAGARWWPWHIYSGWWLGAALRYQEFSEGGLGSTLTTEGDRLGGTLSAGYSRMIGKHFNLDFGLGLWAGYSLYSVYACQNCGRILDSGSKVFVLPSELMIGINYIF